MIIGTNSIFYSKGVTLLTSHRISQDYMYGINYRSVYTCQRYLESSVPSMISRLIQKTLRVMHIRLLEPISATSSLVLFLDLFSSFCCPKSINGKCFCHKSTNDKCFCPKSTNDKCLLSLFQVFHGTNMLASFFMHGTFCEDACMMDAKTMLPVVICINVFLYNKVTHARTKQTHRVLFYLTNVFAHLMQFSSVKSIPRILG